MGNSLGSLPAQRTTNAQPACGTEENIRDCVSVYSVPADILHDGQGAVVPGKHVLAMLAPFVREAKFMQTTRFGNKLSTSSQLSAKWERAQLTSGQLGSPQMSYGMPKVVNFASDRRQCLTVTPGRF